MIGLKIFLYKIVLKINSICNVSFKDCHFLKELYWQFQNVSLCRSSSSSIQDNWIINGIKRGKGQFCHQIENLLRMRFSQSVKEAMFVCRDLLLKNFSIATFHAEKSILFDKISSSFYVKQSQCSINTGTKVESFHR